MSGYRNIRCVIAFDGTRFAGWQKQRTGLTIQGLLEDAVATMTGEQTVVHGAGRTDAGVHALAMTANFQTASNIPCTGFMKGLNSILPDDIRVLETCEAPADFHARRSARAKTYIYTINTSPVQMPTSRLYAAHFPRKLDTLAMKNAADLLVGVHDFSSFEATGSRDRTQKKGRGAVREILGVAINVSEDGHLQFEITGNGFLRHMVRNIVGTLLEVGELKKTKNDFTQILAAQNRARAGPTAPACGLFLKEVLY